MRLRFGGAAVGSPSCLHCIGGAAVSVGCSAAGLGAAAASSLRSLELAHANASASHGRLRVIEHHCAGLFAFEARAEGRRLAVFFLPLICGLSFSQGPPVVGVYIRSRSGSHGAAGRVWKIVSAHRVAAQTAEKRGFFAGFRPYRNCPNWGGSGMRCCVCVCVLACVSTSWVGSG